MKYIQADFSKMVDYGENFDNPLYAHGREKIGFGSSSSSPDNPTSVCVGFGTGGELLEVADWDDGSSAMAAMSGGDRDLVVADKPFARDGDTDCTILGVLKYRQGSQPKLYVDGETVPGGANRFTSFVSDDGSAESDPKPQRVNDSSQPEEYQVNRETGQAAWSPYYVHIYRLDVKEGRSYPALTLQSMGALPKTDVTFPKPE